MILPQNFLSKLLLLLPVIMGAGLLFININKPFVGHHDFMSAYIGKIAKNYLEYGVLELKFGQAVGHIKGPINEHKSYQTSYLPLLPLMTALSFYVLGVSEFSVRIVPVIFSLLGVVFFYLLISKLWDKNTAIIACLFYILTPMFIYFGKLPAPEPLVLSMMLATLYFYIRWLEKQSMIDFGLMVTFLLVGGFAGWPILYMIPLIILHSFLGRKFKPVLFLLAGILFLIPFLQFLHLYILTGEIGGGLLTTFKQRFAGDQLSFGGVDFTLINYIKQEISWINAYFTKTLILLSLIFLIFSFKKKFGLQKYVVYFLLILGIAHPALFSRYVFIHDFLNIYLLPFLALSASLGIYYIVNFLNEFKISKLFIYLFIFGIFVFFVFERFEFTKTLLETNMNRPGLEMSKILNHINYGNKKIVVVSPRFASFFGVFTSYYSDYGYDVVSEDDLVKINFAGDYDYLITIDQDISNRNLYNQLINKYDYNKFNEITVFKLNEKS